MKKTVITAGKNFIDIDAYSAFIAYRELLKSEGKEVYAITSGEYNESISNLIKEIPYTLDSYEPTNEDEFIIVDVSNPEHLDPIVNKENIIEIIDHHTGYEEYWQNKTTSNIEFIGSVCTQIYELYVAKNKLHLLNTDLCKLLVAGILDNTLDLEASITTKRDIDAYNELLKMGDVDTNWSELYFKSCEETIKEDLIQSLINDIKIEYTSSYLPEVFGQILLFDKEIIFERIKEVKELFNSYKSDWIINLICISDSKSYIIASKSSQERIEKLFNSTFEKDTLVLNKFMLRKEIIKRAREMDNNIA